MIATTTLLCPNFSSPRLLSLPLDIHVSVLSCLPGTSLSRAASTCSYLYRIIRGGAAEDVWAASYHYLYSPLLPEEEAVAGAECGRHYSPYVSCHRLLRGLHRLQTNVSGMALSSSPILCSSSLSPSLGASHPSHRPALVGELQCQNRVEWMMTWHHLHGTESRSWLLTASNAQLQLWDLGARSLWRRFIVMDDSGREIPHLERFAVYPSLNLLVVCSGNDLMVFDVSLCEGLTEGLTEGMPYTNPFQPLYPRKGTGVLQGHTKRVTHVCISQLTETSLSQQTDSPVVIASCSLDGSVRLWHAVTLLALCVIRSPAIQEGLQCIDLKGNILLAGSHFGAIGVWRRLSRMNDWVWLGRLPSHLHRCTSVRVSRGSIAISASVDGTLQRVDVARATVIDNPVLRVSSSGSKSGLYACVCVGDVVLSGDNSGCVTVWEASAPTSPVVREARVDGMLNFDRCRAGDLGSVSGGRGSGWQAHSLRITAMTVSMNLGLVLTAGDGKVRLWEFLPPTSLPPNPLPPSSHSPPPLCLI